MDTWGGRFTGWGESWMREDAPGEFETHAILLTGRRDAALTVTGRRDAALTLTGRRGNTLTVTGEV